MDRLKIKSILNPIYQLCVEECVHNLENIQEDVVLIFTKSTELFKHRRFEECIETVQAVLDVTWEELNTGHWSLVPECQRSVYAAASLLKVKALVCQTLESTAGISMSCLESAVKTADMGLLLGNSHRDELSLAARILTQAINSENPKPDSSEPNIIQSPSSEGKLQVPTEAVCQLMCPSLETFSSNHFYPRLPVKITGCMTEWPALQRWSDLNYLLEKAGSRTVPVELGSSYSDSDWSQKLMSLRDFITLHVNNSNRDKLGYLAQHQLFNQVPELKNDIKVPDYCACSDLVEGEEGEDVDINAWFGPSGTISPLHHDPKHNLLCQVVGRKRVVLYAPAESDHLYPHKGRLLANTARVDPENPDFKQFPRYRNTQAVVCFLSPGEMLYIPPHWWHHVRSLDVSFSVSFWWL